MEARRPGLSALLQKSILFAVLVFSALTPALGGPRSFRMALWNGNDLGMVDYGWLYPGSIQPKNHPVILNISGVYDRSDLESYLNDLHYDWSLIAGVIVDEPYLPALKNSSLQDCQLSQSAPTTVTNTESAVNNAATVIHSLGSTTRFWVNFSEPELQWMMYCDSLLNQPYIDVVSIDKYGTPFTSIQPYYDWLESNYATLYQQFALVPGTYHHAAPSTLTAAVVAGYLQGFFDYANLKNANRQAKPLVWVVMGFADDVFVEQGITFLGIHASGSEQIAKVWLKQRYGAWNPQTLFMLDQ